MTRPNPKYTPTEVQTDHHADRQNLTLDYTQLHETIPVSLKIDEVPLYEYLCRQFNVDSDARLSGRRLDVSPFHYAQLTVMAAQISAEELVHTDEVLIEDGHPSELLDRLMTKIGRSFLDSGLRETTKAFSYDVVHDDNAIAQVAEQAGERRLPDVLEPRYPRDQ